jgi:hypothetical protein
MVSVRYPDGLKENDLPVHDSDINCRRSIRKTGLCHCKGVPTGYLFDRTCWSSNKANNEANEIVLAKMGRTTLSVERWSGGCVVAWPKYLHR